MEITIREVQFGDGLVKGKLNDSLGMPHSGLSSDLDALAAYLASIEIPDSPYAGDSDTVKTGKQLFGRFGCDTCHTPPLYTDLELHDVGTGDLVRNRNVHGNGTKFDTPSLRGVWLTGPFFHDGSAATLQQVFQIGTVHNIFSNMDPGEVVALIDFMKALPD